MSSAIDVKLNVIAVIFIYALYRSYVTSEEPGRRAVVYGVAFMLRVIVGFLFAVHTTLSDFPR